MTYEATEAHITGLRRSGALKLFEPDLAPGEVYRRRLWLHPSVDVWVNSKGGSPAEQRFFDDLRAFLKAFVTGEDFDDDVRLKKLKPATEHLYELRVTFHPAFRLFGAFTRSGEFVVMTHKDKSTLVRDGYSASRARANSLWAALFPQLNKSSDARGKLLGDFDVEGK